MARMEKVAPRFSIGQKRILMLHAAADWFAGAGHLTPESAIVDF